jgi:hypothetical protein
LIEPFMSIARPHPSFAALLALVMPKCPLCGIALFSALGIELRFIAPVTIALIIIPVLMIALRHVSVLVPLAAAAGAAVAISGRFILELPFLFHAGVVAVIAMALLNTILLRRRCRECALTS